MNILYLKITHLPTNFMPLTNAITRQSIMLESYPNHQKTCQVFESAMKKNCFGLTFSGLKVLA